jgi:hypothetical protein
MSNENLGRPFKPGCMNSQAVWRVSHRMVDGNRLSGPKIGYKRAFTKDGEAGRECM